jgi:hypothetical protein
MEWSRRDSEEVDGRDQPWKEWVEEELKARRDAEQTPEGRRDMEKKLEEYRKKRRGQKADNDGTNKAG